MGKLFELDAGTKSIIQDVFDDLIGELGKPCRLVYPPKWEACVNCSFDTIGRKSTNRWKTGGPLPFPNGTTCPLCNGAGQKASEVSENMTFLCEWEPGRFFYPIRNLDVRIPYSIVQTKGYLSDLPKVLRADHLVFEIPVEGLNRQTFKLFDEPGDRSNIIQGRYMVATWKRA